jgi:hypothetical protein
MFGYCFYGKIDLWAIFEDFMLVSKKALVFDPLCQSNHKTVQMDKEV